MKKESKKTDGQGEPIEDIEEFLNNRFSGRPLTEHAIYEIVKSLDDYANIEAITDIDKSKMPEYLRCMIAGHVYYKKWNKTNPDKYDGLFSKVLKMRISKDRLGRGEKVHMFVGSSDSNQGWLGRITSGIFGGNKNRNEANQG